jgi:3',5'-cyclic AMP phosphodiesterase CpdA
MCKFINKMIRLLLSIFILLLPLSCAKNRRTPVKSLRFAVIGNTYPESPFSGFNRELDLLVEEINRANPVLLFHTGNIVHGGKSWMGIKDVDLERQFREFRSSMKKLGPVLYTVPGSMDSLDGKKDIYRKYTGRDNYYSFNYGALHFIVLDTKDEGEIIDKAQMEWLEKDLEKYRGAQAVIVFTHHPLFRVKGKRIIHKAGEKLQGLFKFYPVKAVFSGNLESYYRADKEGIEYHITGTRLLHHRSWSRNRVHYYIIDFDGVLFKVEKKELDLKKR